MNNSRIKNSHIVIIDDHESNVHALRTLLEWSGYTNVTGVTDPVTALRICELFSPDLVLLDLHMAPIDGFEMLRLLKEQSVYEEYVPILVFTADANPETRKRALALGANDFLTKPGDADEIVLRVQNFLEARQLHSDLQEQNAALERRVHERTNALETARIEMLEHLAKAAEYRDDDTGEHTRRVGELACSIAIKMGVTEIDPELLLLAAPLHDIGKIGVPDSILLKQDKLTAEEYAVMKNHTNMGAEILKGSLSPLLQMAALIALTHHEKWDGSGYPQGLRREEIPLVGRIVAVADVYDALTHERPYKRAWPQQDAEAEIARSSGTHFDPAVVEAFFSLKPEHMFQMAA